MSRVVLLGLDGATYSLLDPLLQSGRLPRLAQLAQSGVRGALRSTIHPLTPAAWTSCVTGLNPGKHGVYDFRRRRPGSYVLEPVNARQRQGAPLWDILGRQGRRCGVFNTPLTYPPDRVDGFLVSGMDAPGVSSDFVYPPALHTRLLAAVPDYRIDLDEETADEIVLLERIQALASAELRALDFLLREHADLDFLMAVFVATDRLYHTFWRYLDPKSTDVSEIARAARHAHERILHDIDDALVRLQAWAGDDATFIVVSDHGFGPLHKDVYINRFLLDAGLLRLLPGKDGAPFAEMVDWQHTQAYSFGFFGNISLNLRGREPQGCVEQGRQAEDVKRALTAALQALRDPADGKPLVDAVYRREELYSGPYVEDAPDLLLVMRDYAYMTRDGYEAAYDSLLAPPMHFSKGRVPHSGNHRLDGILIMGGPGIAAGAEINGATLPDIAPTVLYALGLSAPDVMDGHVLRQAFAPVVLQQRPPRRIVMPAAPPQNAAQRQIAGLAHKVAQLERTVSRMEQDKAGAAAYARRLEEAVAAKNAHIAEIEAALQEREHLLAQQQNSLFMRAYQRWHKRFGGG